MSVEGMFGRMVRWAPSQLGSQEDRSQPITGCSEPRLLGMADQRWWGTGSRSQARLYVTHDFWHLSRASARPPRPFRTSISTFPGPVLCARPCAGVCSGYGCIIALSALEDLQPAGEADT